MSSSDEDSLFYSTVLPQAIPPFSFKLQKFCLKPLYTHPKEAFFSLKKLPTWWVKGIQGKTRKTNLDPKKHDSQRRKLKKAQHKDWTIRPIPNTLKKSRCIKQQKPNHFRTQHKEPNSEKSTPKLSMHKQSQTSSCPLAASKTNIQYLSHWEPSPSMKSASVEGSFFMLPLVNDQRLCTKELFKFLTDISSSWKTILFLALQTI